MDKHEFKNMWVHIEHSDGKVCSAAFELCCEIRKLCDLSGDKLIGVIAGSIPVGEMEKLKECGIDGAIVVSGTGYAGTCEAPLWASRGRRCGHGQARGYRRP